MKFKSKCKHRPTYMRARELGIYKKKISNKNEFIQSHTYTPNIYIDVCR